MPVLGFQKGFAGTVFFSDHFLVFHKILRNCAVYTGICTRLHSLPDAEHWKCRFGLLMQNRAESNESDRTNRSDRPRIIPLFLLTLRYVEFCAQMCVHLHEYLVAALFSVN